MSKGTVLCRTALIGVALACVRDAYGPVTIARAAPIDFGGVWSAETRSSQWVGGPRAEAMRGGHTGASAETAGRGNAGIFQ